MASIRRSSSPARQRTTCSTGPNTSSRQLLRAVERDDRRGDEMAAARRLALPDQRARRRHGRRSSAPAAPSPRCRSPGRHGSRGRAGRRASARAPRPRSSPACLSATSSCRQSRRSAEQRWPAERKAEVTTSSVTCSGSAVASTIMALMPPVSAISGTIGPSLAASARLMRLRRRGRAGEGDAGDARMRHQPRADVAIARHEMQRAGGHARLVQQRTPRNRRRAASARRASPPPHCRRRAPPRPGR